MSLTKVSFSMISGAVANVLDYGAYNDGTHAAETTVAIQAAMDDVANGTYRGTVYFPSGAYAINASIRIMPPSVANGLPIKPMVVRGEGWNTQINNLAPASNPTFDLSGASGVQIRDLLLTGNTTNPNDGIVISGATHSVYYWTVENIVFQMIGVGLKLTDTNTGIIRDCKFWPDTSANGGYAPLIPQVISSFSGVSHGIHFTGGFVHDVMIDSCEAVSYTGFASGACGIRGETTGQCHGIRVIGGLYQSLDLTTSTVNCGIKANFWYSAIIDGLYFEGSTLSFTNLETSRVSNCGNGGVGGQLTLGPGCEYNLIQGVYCESAAIGGAFANTFIGCRFQGGTFSDDTDPQYGKPQRYINCILGANYTRDAHQIWKLQVDGPGTITPDPLQHQAYLIRCGAGAITIAAPVAITLLVPYDGMLLTFTIQNGAGGAMGVITWNGVYSMSAWTNPADGYNRSITFMYDSGYSRWRQISQTGADVPNS